jgi:hypothetical protein
MAKQVGISKFTGRIDNVIGYRRNGVYCVRTMPETVRQTAATRRAARSFGMASRKGKLIRRALCPYMDLRHDGTHVNRLNRELIAAGNSDLQLLRAFRFNKHSTVGNLFLIPPVLRPEGLVQIPAQEFLAPGKATHLEVRVIAARINFAEQKVMDVNAVTAIIDLTKPFNGTEFNVPVAGKGTLILAMQVRACEEDNGKLYAIGGRRYMAADIISIAPADVAMQKEKKRKGKRPVYREHTPHIAARSGNILQPVFTCRLE